MSESDDDVQLDQLLGDSPLVGGRSMVMRDSETGHRTPPTPSRLARFQRSVRVAEIICHRTRERAIAARPGP